ncbi:hypothetical protein AM500_13250 [Bacillus sp. FJAT-18017]|uniref:hypothetical protein n=1 Tax=Bacillus sp. FJAT-18017 TaxID=1705566 RepID=UPI0006B0354B|nr:hypothetical protein [Bacillus sp. FJAT-18017]ALC90644.1 hypothetical protein AM500_13250 [Bacillus sp. FJAT-18017]
MNRYFKLVNFEISRFFKLYISLLLILVVTEFAGVFSISKWYMNQANKLMVTNSLSATEYVHQYGQTSFISIIDSLWFIGPIGLSAAALIFYVFMIWYREWNGKNTFAYRLLMLPIPRLTIFFAKATAIFLMVLGLVAAQILLFPVQKILFEWLVPGEFRILMGISETLQASVYVSIILPSTFSEFILFYGVGFTALLVIFTAILFERCYRVKGIFIGIMYCVAAGTLFASPFLLMAWMNYQFFYPIEILLIEFGLILLIATASIWTSRLLLNKKITV